MPEIQGYLTGSKRSELYEATITASHNNKWRLDTNTTFTDGPSNDAFGRLRVGQPLTIFDSKQIFDNQPLFWNEMLETGAGITSSYSQNLAATTITSTLNTAGKFTRQTFQRFNYQPGKSQLIFMTGILDKLGGGTGVQRRIGYFDDNNGLFFEDDEGTIKVVVRSKTSGTPDDTKIAQADWNLDPLDGTGSSGFTIDFTKAQIYVIDFEWLGVGRIRFGIVVNGLVVYVHQVNNTNDLDAVYMSTPNLPLRYQMITTSSSPASKMDCICASVSSEGGVDNLGTLRHKDSGSVGALSAGSEFALIGLRLKDASKGANILLETVSIISTSTNDQAHWELVLNPVVSGTFTYTDLGSSNVQIAVGTGINRVTNGGIEIDGGYFATALPITKAANNALRLGFPISGASQTIVLTARPITNNITVQGSLTWRELS